MESNVIPSEMVTQLPGGVESDVDLPISLLDVHDEFIVENDGTSGCHNKNSVFPSINNAVSRTEMSTKKFKCSDHTINLDDSSSSVQYVTPVRIPNGPTLFVTDSACDGSSQVVAVASNTGIVHTEKRKKDRNLKSQPDLSINSQNHNSIMHSSVVKSDLLASSFSGENKQTADNVCFVSNSEKKAFYHCEFCGENGSSEQFHQFSSLSRHYLKIHGKRLIKQGSVSCRERDCKFQSWKIGDLRDHLTTSHGIQHPVQRIVFHSMHEFLQWKLNEEYQSCSRFVRSSGHHPLRSKGIVHQYFSCQRSGKYRPSKKDVKCSKSNGSIKMNGHCTASITLASNQETGIFSCEYYPSHYGHDTKLESRNLSLQEKRWIHDLLMRGWNSEEIVKTLRNATIAGTTDRMRKVVRQDISNICRSHGKASFDKKDPDDGKSLDLWAHHLQEKSLVPTYISASAECAEDFFLVVMDDQHVNLAQRQGCTFYVANYPIMLERQYRLMALTVLSDNQTYLLSYALTCRDGSDALKAILSAVRNKIGDIKPKYIFSQEPAVSGNIWSSFITSEVESNPVHLMPSWKVESDWNDYANKLIRDESQRYSVRKCLDILISEKDPSKFSAFLQLFNRMLNTDISLTAFSRYFNSNYADKTEFWAQTHEIPNISSFKRFDKELELIVHRSRQKKRLDKCVFSLQYVIDHQPFEPVVEFSVATVPVSVGCDLPTLQETIACQLQTLVSIVQQSSSLPVLRTISHVVNQAAHTIESVDL